MCMRLTHESTREKCCSLAHGLCLELPKMQERFIVSLQEPRKSHELICIKWTGGSKKTKKKQSQVKLEKSNFVYV